MGGYAIVMIGISLYFTKMVKNSDDFYGSNGKTSFWLSGLSFFMSAFSASVFVANASIAYRHGTLNLLLIIAQFPVFIAGYFFFAGRWRNTGCATVIEFIGKRFGPKCAKFFLWMGIPMRILETGNRLYVTAVLFEAILGLELIVGASITAGIALLSTIGGGFLALVVTDAVQAILLTLIVAILALLSWNAVGGWESFLEKVPQDFWSVATDDTGFGLPLIAAWAIVALFAWNGNWSLVQRFVSVPTSKDAKRVSAISGIAYYLLFPMIAIPAMAAVILVPGLDTPQKAEYAYILVAKQLLPAGLMAMLCFGMLGVTVTSVSSDLNVMSQVTVKDMLKRRFTNVSERKKLLLGRLVMVLLCVICTVLSLQVRSMGGAFQYLLMVLGMTTLPTFMPLLYGLLWPVGDSRSAILSFSIGIGISLLLKLGFDVSLATIILSNGATTTLVYFGMATLGGKRENEAEVQAIFECIRRPKSDAQSQAGTGAQGRAIARVAAVTLLLCGMLALIAEILTPENPQNSGMALSMAIVLFVIGSVIYFINRKKHA